MRPLDELRPRIRAKVLPYPPQIFSNCLKPLKPVPCIVVDLLEALASMLINTDVVGENAENFQFHYKEEFNEDNERTFGNVTSGFWFKMAEKAIRRRWGSFVSLLSFAICCDKTHVDRVGGISVWPCYLTIMNLDASVRRAARGSDIIGYLPILPYSDSQISDILIEDCGVLRKCDEVVKMTKYFLEQSFYNNLLSPVKKIEETGPIMLQIGQDTQNVHAFIPKLMVYICKQYLHILRRR